MQEQDRVISMTLLEQQDQSNTTLQPRLDRKYWHGNSSKSKGFYRTLKSVVRNGLILKIMSQNATFARKLDI